jgi:hypothetical protein
VLGGEPEGGAIAMIAIIGHPVLIQAMAIRRCNIRQENDI